MGIVSCRLVVMILVVSSVGASSVYGDVEVDIRSHREQVKITGRLAVTTVSQTYVNYTDDNQEVVVNFVLPPGSTVHELAMWVEGLRSPAVLHPRVAARQIYREIREAGRARRRIAEVGEDSSRHGDDLLPADGSGRPARAAAGSGQPGCHGRRR